MPLENASLEDVDAVLDPLREISASELEAEGFPRERIRVEAQVDMRYVGQAFELTTPVPADAREVADLVAAFHRLYEERYTHADDGPVEAVSFRVSAYGLTEKPALPHLPTSDVSPEPFATRAVIFEGDPVATPVYRRDTLHPGPVVDGPALIEEDGAATLVPPGFTVRCHESAALLLTRDDES